MTHIVLEFDLSDRSVLSWSQSSVTYASGSTGTEPLHCFNKHKEVTAVARAELLTGDVLYCGDKPSWEYYLVFVKCYFK